MRAKPYLVPSLDHGEGIQCKAHGGSSQRAGEQIALGSQLGEGRRRVGRGGRAQGSEVWGCGKERTELVQSCEVERDAGDVSQ